MIVNRLFSNEPFTSRLSALNFKDDANHYTVELVAPKRKKSDFSLTVDEDVLTIEAHTSEKDKSYLYYEWNDEYVKRRVRLPKDAKHGGITAKYRGGVLTVVIPKDEAKKPRMIEVS